MSDKCDLLGKELQKIIQSTKDMREGNRILKEQNNDLRNEF